MINSSTRLSYQQLRPQIRHDTWTLGREPRDPAESYLIEPYQPWLVLDSLLFSKHFACISFYTLLRFKFSGPERIKIVQFFCWKVPIRLCYAFSFSAAHCLEIDGRKFTPKDLKIGLGKLLVDYYANEEDSIIASVSTCIKLY